MPVEFDLIETTDLQALKTEVNRLLAKGWLFHGPMLIDRSDSQRNFIQPMVRLELRPLAMPKDSGIIPVQQIR